MKQRFVGDGGFARDDRVTGLLDAYFDVLADRRARYVLYYLSTIPAEASDRAELADVVCAYEAAGTDPPRSDSRVRIARDLHHRLLPRLEDAGLVEYDAGSGRVSYMASSAFEEWLEAAEAEEIRNP